MGQLLRKPVCVTSKSKPLSVFLWRASERSNYLPGSCVDTVDFSYAYFKKRKKLSLSSWRHGQGLFDMLAKVPFSPVVIWTWIMLLLVLSWTLLSYVLEVWLVKAGVCWQEAIHLAWDSTSSKTTVIRNNCVAPMFASCLSEQLTKLF